jgi:hypothetical protein
MHGAADEVIKLCGVMDTKVVDGILRRWDDPSGLIRICYHLFRTPRELAEPIDPRQPPAFHPVDSEVF